MTYNELVDQIRSYTEVDANVLSTTVVNGIIKNAEFRVLRDVDSDNNRRYATSQFVTNQRYLDLPNDILIIRSVQVSDGVNFDSGTNRTFMEKRDTSFISEYNGSGTTGQPKYYANWDENTIVVVKNKTFNNLRIMVMYQLTFKILKQLNFYYPKLYEQNAISEKASGTVPKAAPKAEKLHLAIELPYTHIYLA